MNRRISKGAKKKTAGKGPSAGVPRPFRLPSVFRPPEQSNVPLTMSDRPENRHSIGVFHLLFICLALAVAATGALYHLTVRFEGVRLGYEVSEQRKIQTRLMLQRRELRLELASMKELGRIEDEAREKLGMETPKAEEFVHINKTKKVVSVSGGAL